MYPHERPAINEYVHVTYTQIEPDYCVKVTLNEYNDCEGAIYLADISRKRKIKSLIKECPIGQSVVVQVIQSDKDFISLSRRNMHAPEQEKYLEWYGLSRRLQAIMRKIAFQNKIPLEDVCAAISWPLYSNLDSDLNRGDNLQLHPFNVLADKQKIQELLDSDNDNNVNKSYIADYILADHENLFGHKTYDETYIVQMLSYGINGVSDIKEVLTDCLEIESQFETGTKLNIIMDECPKYTFKFTGPNVSAINEYIAACKALLLGGQKNLFVQEFGAKETNTSESVD